MSNICNKCKFSRKKMRQPYNICSRDGTIIRESSGCIYGNNNYIFIAEKHSKLFGERSWPE